MASLRELLTTLPAKAVVDLVDEFERWAKTWAADDRVVRLADVLAFLDAQTAPSSQEDGCAPYLKEGETPAECLARNRRDIDVLMTLLAREKEEVARLRQDDGVTVWPAPSPETTQAQTIEVVVNGQPVSVVAGPIREVVAEAVRVSGQIGAPIDQWVLRTRGGEVIPHQLPGGLDYALIGGQRVFMHLGLPETTQARADEGRQMFNAERERMASNLLDAKYLNPECAENGCQFLQAGAAPSPVGEAQWQPFETAPRNGSHFLAATKFMGQPVVEVIWWDRGWQGAQGEWRFDAWMPYEWLLTPLAGDPPVAPREKETKNG